MEELIEAPVREYSARVEAAWFGDAAGVVPLHGEACSREPSRRMQAARGASLGARFMTLWSMSSRAWFSGAAMFALLSATSVALCAEPIVLAQSLPLTGAGFTASTRIVAGTTAAVDAFNRSGGIAGRQVRLETVDDADDPSRTAANLRRLANEVHPVAFLNCVGTPACAAAASVARSTQIPLIGPMSGAPALRSMPDTPVYCIRPDVTLEATSIASQLKSLGVSSVAILTDHPASDHRSEILSEALRRKGLKPSVVRTAPAAMGESLKRTSYATAILIDLDLQGAEALGELPAQALEERPQLIASLATPGLATIIRLFPKRVIGFTAVVPQPELPNSPLVRGLLRDSEQIGPDAMTYEGLEAYVSTLVALEAIRRAGPRADARTVAVEMARLGHIELGQFPLTFSRPGRSASEWVDIALRARNGVLLR